MVRVRNEQVELDEIRNQMQRHVDPRGGVSYTGADYKAIIFLPYDMDAIKEKREELQKQAFDAIDAQTAIKIKRAEYTREYNAAVAAADIQLQLYYTNLLAQISQARINQLDNEIKVNTALLKRLGDLLDNTPDGGTITRPVVLGDIQTITISVHREKFPVRTLGRVYPKSYTRGPRTVAGSMIFTVFNKHALYDLLQTNRKFYSTGVMSSGADSGYPELSTVVVDQLPPFDITLIASNELGDNSYAAIYGAEIVNEGMTMSIQDLITENVMQFVARDFDPLRPLTARRAILETDQPIIKTADMLLKERFTAVERQQQRMNPFM